jgi:peptidoglycan/LPS O-acetylase OafA/YrhL
MVEFVIGVLLARAVELRSPSHRPPRYLPELLAAFIALGLVASAPDILLAGLLALMVPSLGTSEGWLARALASRALVALGERSYALYMTHGLVLHLLEALAGARLASSTPVDERALMTFAAAVALAVTTELTHRWIEEPARAWMRRLSPRGLRVAVDAERTSVR